MAVKHGIGLGKIAPASIFPRAILAERGVPRAPAYSLGPVLIGPANDAYGRVTGDLVHLFEKLLHGVDGGAVIVEKNRVCRMQIAMKTHPVADPRGVIILAQGKKHPPATEDLTRVWPDIEDLGTGDGL